MMSISPMTPANRPQFSGHTNSKDQKATDRLTAIKIKPNVIKPKLYRAAQALADQDTQTLDQLLIEADSPEKQLKPWHNSLAVRSAKTDDPQALQRTLLLDAIHRGLPTDGFFKSSNALDE